MKEILSHAGAIKFMTPQPQSITVEMANLMTVTWKHWALHYTHKTLCPGHWMDYSVRLRQSTDWPHVNISGFIVYI